MRTKILIGALLVGSFAVLQVQLKSSRDTIRQERTESLRKLEELEQSSSAKIEQLATTTDLGLKNIAVFADKRCEAVETRLETLTVFPARLEGLAVIVDASHPGFTQFAQRYASLGAGDLKHLVVYSNAAFAVFEHNLAVLPLNGTTFAPEPRNK